MFKPRHYFPLLGESLFRGVIQQYGSIATASGALPTVSYVFRMFSEKLIRIGQTNLLLQSWLSGAASGLYDQRVEKVHRLLLASLPESCHEALLLQLSKQEDADKHNQKKVGSAPKYRLVSLIPRQVAVSKQFQYVVTHKLLLKKPFADLFFLRALIDVLAHAGGQTGDEAMTSASTETPLSTIFDVVVTRWSQSAFVGTADYALNASICFFLRYSTKLLSPTSAFSQRDWIPKLCKGVQDHMNHSLERTRILGMRVGETLSLVISPENPLNFEITGSEDPMEIYGNVAFDASPACDLVDAVDKMSLSKDDEALGASHSGKASRRAKKTRKAASKPFALDPDEILDSDDSNGESEEEEEATAGSDDDSDSDMSLDAYDMEDDEEDLTAKRPVYLKDLIAGLHAEDDREKTEAALVEAEVLLRKRPRDLHENAAAVVTALLRLEDKYNTPSFSTLRANALAAACAVSPLKTIPYFHSQALEREQLLQSRIDVLQAMVAASQELAEVGDNFKLTMGSQKKSLLDEDLDAQTTRELKTHRWGYRRDPLAQPKKNAFAEYALRFFSPLLFGYIEYVRTHSSPANKTSLSDLENVFLAHLLHALGVFVECAGNAPQAISMAKCLLEFAWVQRLSGVAAVRRQVIFSISRVLLVVPPFLLRQEMGESIVDMLAWLHQVNRQDPDEGCREGSRLLLSSGAIPMLSLQ